MDEIKLIDLLNGVFRPPITTKNPDGTFSHTFHCKEPVTGNIYCDGFWDSGRYYRNYYADCMCCGKEIAIYLSSEAKRCSTYLRSIGWEKAGWNNTKWICKECFDPIKSKYYEIKFEKRR